MSTGTPLLGCRSAFAVTAFPTIHADDIANSALQYHLPLPGAAGGYARSDGTDWQRVSEIPLADLADYARGSIIRGGAADWEAHAAEADGAILVGDGTDVAATVNPVLTGTLTLPNAGLHLLDTGGDHDLIISPGTDLSVDRVLTLTTGDAARTITLSGDPTLADWFDQSVKQAASPTFADVFVPDGGTIGITGNELLTFNAAGTAVFSGCDVGVGVVPDYTLELQAAAGVEPRFAMSNTNVNQPATDIDQADVWGTILPISATAGGMKVRGLSDTDATAMIFQGIIGSANPTDTVPAIDFVAYKSNGGTAVAALGPTETVFQLHNSTTALVTVLGIGTVGIGTRPTAGKLHVDQSSTTAAIPVLTLDQADLSEQFINFVSTIGDNNPIRAAAIGALYGGLRITINGVDKYLAIYNVP